MYGVSKPQFFNEPFRTGTCKYHAPKTFISFKARRGKVHHIFNQEQDHKLKIQGSLLTTMYFDSQMKGENSLVFVF